MTAIVKFNDIQDVKIDLSVNTNMEKIGVTWAQEGNAGCGCFRFENLGVSVFLEDDYIKIVQSRQEKESEYWKVGFYSIGVMVSSGFMPNLGDFDIVSFPDTSLYKNYSTKNLMQFDFLGGNLVSVPFNDEYVYIRRFNKMKKYDLSNPKFQKKGGQDLSCKGLKINDRKIKFPTGQTILRGSSMDCIDIGLSHLGPTSSFLNMHHADFMYIDFYKNLYIVEFGSATVEFLGKRYNILKK